MGKCEEWFIKFFNSLFSFSREAKEKMGNENENGVGKEREFNTMVFRVKDKR